MNTSASRGTFDASCDATTGWAAASASNPIESTSAARVHAATPSWRRLELDGATHRCGPAAGDEECRQRNDDDDGDRRRPRSDEMDVQ